MVFRERIIAVTSPGQYIDTEECNNSNTHRITFGNFDYNTRKLQITVDTITYNFAVNNYLDFGTNSDTRIQFTSLQTTGSSDYTANIRIFCTSVEAWDSTKPEIVITSPVASHGTYSTSDSYIHVSGTCSDNLKMGSVKYKSTAHPNEANANLGNPATTWVQTNMELVMGSNLIEVVAVDDVGNRSFVDWIMINRTSVADTELPTIYNLSRNTNDIVNVNEIGLAGWASDNKGISNVSVNGINATLHNPNSISTSWLVTIQLPNVGLNGINIIATDINGNTSTEWLNIYREDPYSDNTNPTIQLFSHFNNQVVDTDTIELSGTVYDNKGVSRVTIESVDVTLGSIGSTATTWRKTINLAIGNNSIDIIAYDAAGNSKTLTVNITRIASIPQGYNCGSCNIKQDNGTYDTIGECELKCDNIPIFKYNYPDCTVPIIDGAYNSIDECKTIGGQPDLTFGWSCSNSCQSEISSDDPTTLSEDQQSCYANCNLTPPTNPGPEDCIPNWKCNTPMDGTETDINTCGLASRENLACVESPPGKELVQMNLSVKLWKAIDAVSVLDKVSSVVIDVLDTGGYIDIEYIGTRYNPDISKIEIAIFVPTSYLPNNDVNEVGISVVTIAAIGAALVAGITAIAAWLLYAGIIVIGISLAIAAYNYTDSLKTNAETNQTNAELRADIIADPDLTNEEKSELINALDDAIASDNDSTANGKNDSCKNLIGISCNSLKTVGLAIGGLMGLKLLTSISDNK